VELVYLSKPGCKSCDRVHHMLRALRSEHPNLVLREVDMGSKEGKELAEALGITYGLTEDRRLIAPTVFSGDTALVGGEIGFDDVTSLVERGGDIPWETVNANLGLARKSIIERFRSMSVLAVLGSEEDERKGRPFPGFEGTGEQQDEQTDDKRSHG
jgi:thiol-disulfide isomerase/thioredoxin